MNARKGSLRDSAEIYPSPGCQQTTHLEEWNLRWSLSHNWKMEVPRISPLALSCFLLPCSRVLLLLLQPPRCSPSYVLSLLCAREMNKKRVDDDDDDDDMIWILIQEMCVGMVVSRRFPWIPIRIPSYRDILCDSVMRRVELRVHRLRKNENVNLRWLSAATSPSRRQQSGGNGDDLLPI